MSGVSAGFYEVKANQGFDGKARPPWLMVPMGRWNYAIFKSNKSVLEFDINVTPKKRVRILRQREFAPGSTRSEKIVFVGLSPGLATVTATHRSSGFSSKMQCAVKRAKTISVHFHLLTSMQGTNHKSNTRRKPSDVGAILNVANDILTPQANVVLSNHGVSYLVLEKSLGRDVRISLSGNPSWSEWNKVTKYSKVTADINVFFVGEVNSGRRGRADNVDGVMGENRCLIEDRIGTSNKIDAQTAGAVLAHEVGHALMTAFGKSGHHKLHGKHRPSRHLMSPYSHPRALKIPKEDANIMNGPPIPTIEMGPVRVYR